ncbi:MAG TPA: DUF4252 domain-containing protein [Candidatus Coprenecus pullicola]|nr:DUF4252 domain-containing protein [Candidatus Coprenecus pullicola]
MRKVVIMLVMVVVAPLWGAAQSFDELMSRYGPNEGVVTVTMSRSLLQRIARRDDNDLLRKLTDLKIISLTAEDGDSLRTGFLEDVGKYTQGLERLYFVSIGNEGSVMSVYVDADCGKALMVSVDNDAVLLMEMLGDIDEQMQDALLNNEIRIK